MCFNFNKSESDSRERLEISHFESKSLTLSSEIIYNYIPWRLIQALIVLTSVVFQIFRLSIVYKRMILGDLELVVDLFRHYCRHEKEHFIKFWPNKNFWAKFQPGQTLTLIMLGKKIIWSLRLMVVFGLTEHDWAGQWLTMLIMVPITKSLT